MQNELFKKFALNFGKSNGNKGGQVFFDKLNISYRYKGNLY